MTVIAVIALLVALMLVGLPIAIAMALTGTIIMLGMGGPDLLVMMAQRLYSSTMSFPLLAIPFFILAGNLMNTGGMTQRIFDFTQLLVGRVRGGLAHVNVLGSMIFAGMSGSAVADAAGLGVVAALYAMLLGFFYYRELRIGDLAEILLVTGRQTAQVMFIIAGAGIFGWVLIQQQIPNQVIEDLLAVSGMPWVILLMVNIILLILGMFIEGIAIMIMVVPIFVPLMVKIGVDPVHFGIVLTLNIMIGLLTPPVGLALYVVADISKVPMSELVVEMWPYMVALLVVLGLVTYVPGFTMFLPHFFGFG